MVKHLVTVFMSTLIGSSLYAGSYDMQSKGFLGAEVGNATVDGQKAGDLFHKGSAVEYGLRFGAQSDKWRATFLFNHFNSTDDDQSVEKGFFTIDYFLFEGVSEINIRPFVGANVGLINYESTLVDATDFVYGGQAGVILGVTESIDLDLSYRYSLSGSMKVNDLGSIVFGLNYLY